MCSLSNPVFYIEREEIFTFIQENRINGVFLIAGDRHRSDAFRIPRPDPAYDFFEATTSHITKDANHNFVDNAIFAVGGGPKFGRLTFKLKKKDPRLIYDVLDLEGEVAASLKVKLSELTIAPTSTSQTSREAQKAEKGHGKFSVTCFVPSSIG